MHDKVLFGMFCVLSGLVGFAMASTIFNAPPDLPAPQVPPLPKPKELPPLEQCKKERMANVKSVRLLIHNYHRYFAVLSVNPETKAVSTTSLCEISTEVYADVPQDEELWVDLYTYVEDGKAQIRKAEIHVRDLSDIR